jgi:hypothetical protein
MYSLFLSVHSWLRWVILILGLVAVVRAIGGRGGRPWTSADESVGKWFIASLDLQFLVGLLLYAWLSPLTRAAFADFGGAMRNSGLRFFAVEHLLGMVLAVALAHIGRVRSRKETTDARRHHVAALFYGIALIILLASIPWPGMPAGRPLFR